MQKEPFQPLAAHFLVKRRFTVLIVTGDRMTGMQGVHADLVSSTCDWTALDQGRFGKLTHDAEPGFGGLAIGTDPYYPFTGLQIVFAQRRINHLDVSLPLATHQRQILLAHRFDPQLFMQAAQGAAFFGNQQYTRGVAIQSMNQLEEAGFRPQGAQPFDNSKAQPAATVYCHAGGLIQHDHGIVFEQDLALQTLDNPEVC